MGYEGEDDEVIEWLCGIYVGVMEDEDGDGGGVEWVRALWMKRGW